MFSWLFKTRNIPGLAVTPPARTTPATKPRNPASGPTAEAQAQAQAQRAAKDSAKAAQAAARAAEDWPGQLQRALGDDAALLQLASNAPGLDIKLAAVEAMAGEDALRQAERAFRTRDRKVHRVAKARLETAVARRTTHATAVQLLGRGEALLSDPQLPVNHLAALDRDWQALPAPLLDPAQQQAYTALRAQLDTAVRARGDAEQAQQRWAAQAKRAAAEAPAALAAAAALDPSAAQAQLDVLRDTLQALRDGRPAQASTEALGAALAALLQDIADTQARLAEPAPTPEPPAAALPDSEAAAPMAQDAAAAQPAPPKERKATPEQCQQLQTLLDQADTALAEGQLALLQRHLQAADTLQAAHKRLVWPAALRARQQALRTEQLRLKDWQRWGGTRARDDLIAEAEVLARLVVPQFGIAPSEQVASAAETATAEPAPAEAHTSPVDILPLSEAIAEAITEAITEPVPEPVPEPIPEPITEAITEPLTQPITQPAVPAEPSAPAPALPRPRLNLRAHATAIHALRMRWKALDKHGDGAHGALWQRFDAALTTAYEPVAAQHAAQQATRQQNLATRQALLDALEAATLPEAGAGSALAAWRDTARQLDAFQQAWRPLGPLEHTVPAEARAALQQRLDAAVERLEQPLRRVREQAAAQREQLIQRAEALIPGDSRAPHGGELQRALRELQADWQDHARALPLPRGMEAALWARFRAATDAVFAQRNAAAATREAEQAAEVAEREALITRLAQLEAQAGVVQIERTLADVHRAWLAAPAQLPRATGQALQARYEAAVAAARALTAAATQARWQAQIDAWTAPVHARAAAADSAADAAPPAAGSPIDDVLLQLEIALDLPAAPEWQAARRQLKLRALKEAMEGRTPPASGPAPAASWLATLLIEPALDAQQTQRLLAVLAALRHAAPGTLGIAVPAA
jgi:hypothetical protein